MTENDNKNILVSGASGFIGRHVVKVLSQSGNRVTGIYRSHEPDVQLQKMVSFKCCDLTNRKSAEDLFKDGDYDIVIHLGGQMRGKRIVDYMENSVRSTENLLRLSEEYGIKTFVQASSIAVYGYVDGEVDETSDRVDLDDYATAKYLCERLVEDSDIETRLCIRLPRVLGEGMDLSYPWIPGLIKKLLNDETVYYFNPDLPYNNMLHVDTVCEFIEGFISKGKNGFHVIGVASSNPISVKNIITILADGLGSKSRMVEKKEDLPRNTCYFINISRALEYGFKPVSVEDTLKKTIEDMKREYGRKK